MALRSTRLPRLDEPWVLRTPDALNSQYRRSITDTVTRLQSAYEQDDVPAVIGYSKELAETIARIVLDQRGQAPKPNEKFHVLLATAHRAIERQPGEGLATDEQVRDVAQGALSIIKAVGKLRNDYGTGHGRALPPEVTTEHALIVVDATFLWCRWVLRRLPFYIDGDIETLVERLQSGIFYKNDLRRMLSAAALDQHPAADAHRVGLAVGQRAIRGTFLVADEGVDSVVSWPDDYPTAYISGVIEGLVIGPNGTVTTEPWAIERAARLLAEHAGAEQCLIRLCALADGASWRPYRELVTVKEVRDTMTNEQPRIPAPIRGLWEELRRLIGSDEPDYF